MSNFFRNLLIVFSLFVVQFNASAQTKKYTISGFIRDASNGETLVAANVVITPGQKGVISNEYGFFSITLEAGSYTLTSSYLGYKAKEFKIELNGNQKLNIELEPSAITKSEVVVEGRRPEDNTKESNMGRIELDVEQIKTLPALLGEVDILKTLQLLPGVQSAGEGTSGFYVRGGGPDQNLILLDEAVVYNASHLFGFFSVFNADAIQNATITKGGMPAQYGGRISSLLNIQMKEGNNKRFQADGGLGLISSRLTLQGPIVKDKGSFIVSGRRTYIDVLADPFIPRDAPAKGSGYYFYDFNAKVNYRLSDKDRIFASAYFGRDVFTFKNAESDIDISIPWGNATTSIRWNHLFNNKLFMNVTGIFSDYIYETEVKQSTFALNLFSSVRNLSSKVDFDYYPNNRNNIKFGGIYTFHTFKPSNITVRSGDDLFNPDQIKRQNAHEAAVYLSDVIDVTDKLQFNAGVRFSTFIPVGPYQFTEFGPNREVLNVQNFAEGERITTYNGLEPRFTFRYQVNSKSSIKGGITRNIQYIHLAAPSGSSLPTDLWVPSTLRTKPQVGWQYALGYFRNFFENKFETSVEVYYKTMSNQIDFRDGAASAFDFNSQLENEFVYGDGESYGAEFFINKRTGDFTGWIGYTLSWSWRQFNDINGGERFPYRFDRRHDLSVVGSYDLNDQWNFSGTFIYGTGNAISLPLSFFIFEGRLIQEYGSRNNYRMPAYHRLDIAATYKPKKNENRKVKSTWTFAIYNVYSRLNPFFLYFDTEGSLQQNSLKVQGKKVSLFPILPSVTWNFKF